MAFTVVAFSESVDEAGALTKLAAVPDQSIRTEGDKIIVPELTNLVGEYVCGGTTLTEARLVSPSLRRLNPLYITPAEKALVPDRKSVV